MCDKVLVDRQCTSEDNCEDSCTSYAFSYRQGIAILEKQAIPSGGLTIIKVDSAP